MAFNWSDPFGLGGASPYGSPLPGVGGNPYNPASAFQYDPATIRRAAISNALLSAGAAMLGQGPSRVPQNFGTSLGQGVAAGLQGADTGVQQAMQRQQFAQQTAGAGQQYQQGKIGLASGYGDLAFQAYRLSRILGREVTPQELMQHPELAQNSFAQPGGQGPTTPAAPQQPGLDPTAQGGQPESTWQPQGGGAPQGGAAPIAPQTAEPAPDSLAAQLSAYDQAINDDLMFNGGKGVSGLEAKKADLIGAPRQAASVAAATDAVTAGGDQAYVKNSADMAANFSSAQPVIQFHDALNSFGPMLSASKGTTNADQFAMVNAALKIMNPQAPTIKPGMTLTLEDAKGIPAQWYKGVQALLGGGNLEPAEKAAILNDAKASYRALAKAYDATVNSIGQQASSLPRPVPSTIWRRDLPPPNTVPPIGYVFNHKMYIGGPVDKQESWEAIE